MSVEVSAGGRVVLPSHLLYISVGIFLGFLKARIGKPIKFVRALSRQRVSLGYVYALATNRLCLPPTIS